MAVHSFVERQVHDAVSALGPRLTDSCPRPVRTGPVDIAIPIFNNAEDLAVCLEALAKSIDDQDTVWLIDDASDDARIERLATQFARNHANTQFVRNASNLGFVGSANLAMTSTHRDLVLLNSDTVVQDGWIEGMQQAVAGNQRAGIVCPVSDNATLLSVLPDTNDGTSQRAAAWWAGDPILPTAHGFCMLIRRSLIDLIGTFDPSFSPGYGEENDYSMRAMKLGFDVLAADRSCVLHSGGGSFGTDTEKLKARNEKILYEKWPAYPALVQSWWRDNPLREKTERVASTDSGSRVLHVLHRPTLIGGTERVTRTLIKQLSARFHQLLVYPGSTDNPWCDFEHRGDDPCREIMLNRRWISAATKLAGSVADLSCPYTERAFARVLGGFQPDTVHLHHIVNWDSLLLAAIASAHGARLIVSLHDFFYYCPIYNQIEFATDQPCGVRHCGAHQKCIKCLEGYAAAGSIPASIESYTSGRHAIMQAMLNRADAIVVPSSFLEERTRQAFPNLDPIKIHVIPHAASLPENPSPDLPARDHWVLGYFGGDDRLKGARLIVELAHHLENEPVEIRVFGRVEGFPSEVPSNVNLHGLYHPDQMHELLAEIDITLVPSFYEETFSLTVSESWAHGIPVMGSDRGALKERIEDGINGWRVRTQSAAAWAKKIRRCISSREIGSVRANLKQRSLPDADDFARAYHRLYGSFSASRSTPEVSATSPTDFEIELRRFRSRHLHPSAPWLCAKSHSAADRIIVGVMRDDWGTPNYRIRLPLEALASGGWCQAPVFHNAGTMGLNVAETVRAVGATQVVIQPFLSDPGLSAMEALARVPDLNVVLVIDDLWTGLPAYNSNRKTIPEDVADRLAYLASLSHRLVLTTEELKIRLRIRHPNLHVVENALPARPWTDLGIARENQRPRIGWAGAPQHSGDLEFLRTVLQRTHDRVDWVFLGMCPESLRPLVTEHQAMVPFADYPDKLAAARLDIAIAPLANNDFNRCKSRLKLLEYGVLGIPVIASRMPPYADAPVELVSGFDPQTWTDAILKLAGNVEKRRSQGAGLKHWVIDNHLIDARLEQWRAAYGWDPHVA